MSMRCAVLNCTSTSKDPSINFHKLPNNEDLFKKWEVFCGQEVNKYAKVCSEHFLPDDYDGNLKVELGFARCKQLRRGAVPSIKKNELASLRTESKKPWPTKISKTSILPQTSTKEADISHKIAKAETHSKLSTAAKPVVKVAYITPKALNKPTKPFCQSTITPVTYAPPTKTSLKTPLSRDLNCTIDYLENKIEKVKKDAEKKTKFLEQRIEALKVENHRLQHCSKMRLEQTTQLENQIVALRQEKIQLESTLVQYQKEKASLETRAKRAEFEQSNLEQKLQKIFSLKQIKMIKNGKRQHWCSEDMEFSVKLYRHSRKMYIMLKKRNYPLPSVRAIQHWCKLKKIPIEDSQDDGDVEIPSSTVRNENQEEEELVETMFDIEMLDENTNEAIPNNDTEEEQNTTVEMLHDDSEACSELDAALKLITYDSDETVSALEDETDVTNAIIFDDTDKAKQNSIEINQRPGIEVQELIIP